MIATTTEAFLYSRSGGIWNRCCAPHGVLSYRAAGIVSISRVEIEFWMSLRGAIYVLSHVLPRMCLSGYSVSERQEIL